MPCTNRTLWRLKCGSWRPCRVGDPDLGWSEEFSFTMPRESYQDGERPRLPGSHHCMVQQYVLQQCAAHSCMLQLTRRPQHPSLPAGCHGLKLRCALRRLCFRKVSRVYRVCNDT